MEIAIINYNAGNITSVQLALERLGLTPVLTRDPERLQRANRVIFPGVGAAGATMQFLRDHQLDRVIKELRQPVLGICLGMQLLCQHSEEDQADCLGIIPHQVKRFPNQPGLKVPHMGWNQLALSANTWLPADCQDEYVYFVHSYFVEEGPETAATSQHGLRFSAALQHENFFATQFHPERSGRVGERILEAFLQQNM
jgi:glutamine amidotransferase